jgi:tRNA threonylcarbamoyladenosine biosynthesis protein TsaB
MKLSIDTSEKDKTVIGLDDRHWQFKIKKYQSEQLLVLIDKALRKQKKNLKDVTTIEVNLGPGSFTGLRVGIAVANALGWALKVPINGQKIGQLAEPRYKRS